VDDVVLDTEDDSGHDDGGKDGLGVVAPKSCFFLSTP
jgi:hypothetical protein